MLVTLTKLIEEHRPLYGDATEGVCICGLNYGVIMPGRSTWLGFAEHLALEIETAVDVRPKSQHRRGRAY